MIDIHTHVLPAIDDGAGTRDESLAMLHMAAAHGTTDLVASPHADSRFRYDQAVVANLIEDLASASGGVPRLHRGCDFHLSVENILRCMDDPPMFTIGGRGALLVELDDTSVPLTTEDIFRKFIGLGITPVVTHPERHVVVAKSSERVERWLTLGAVLQVTAQSLTGFFGPVAERAGWTWLRRGLVHVIASDAHDLEQRPPRLDIARDRVAEELGDEAAHLLFVNNPAALVAGNRAGLQRPRPAPPKPRRTFFGLFPARR